MQQQPNGSDRVTMRDTHDILSICALAHISCLWPFMRRHFGVEFFGLWNAGIGVLMILLILGSRGSAALWFLGAWLLAIVVRRVQTFRAIAAGRRMHSRYWGDPYIALAFTGNPRIAMLLVEPLICLVAGWLLTHVCDIAGRFVMCGALTGPIVVGFEYLAEARAVQAMEDAELVMRDRAETFHRRRGG